MYGNVQYFPLIKKEHVIPSQQGRIDYMLKYEKKLRMGKNYWIGVDGKCPISLTGKTMSVMSIKI